MRFSPLVAMYALGRLVRADLYFIIYSDANCQDEVGVGYITPGQCGATPAFQSFKITSDSDSSSAGLVLTTYSTAGCVGGGTCVGYETPGSGFCNSAGGVAYYMSYSPYCGAA
jgi:hypothetical protein